MNILFYCPFKFNLKSKNLRSLGGIESLNIELAKFLSKSKHNIYLATFCNKLVKQKKLTNLPINYLIKNSSKFKFDKIISSNDPTIFNLFKFSDKFLWLHNKLPIEKAFRKKKFFSIIMNSISSIFVSNYLLKQTTNFYNFKNKIVIPNFLDSEFDTTKVNFNRKPFFVWSVQRTKGLMEVCNIWKEIYKKDKRVKLFIYGVDTKKIKTNQIKEYSNYNIFFMGRVTKKELIKQYNISMGMFCLGYDETFCLNAIEAFSCGLPIISFGYTSLSEISKKNNSFIINDFTSIPKIVFKILNLNSSSRSKIIRYSKNFSRNYSLKKISSLWSRELKF